MRSQTIVVALTFVMALGAAPALAGPDGSVDLFTVHGGVVDLGACMGRTLFFPGVFAQIQISLQMRLAGATAGGISGVEGFVAMTDVRGNPIDRLPGNWVAGITPAPGALATGDFFNASDPDMDGVAGTFRGSIAFDGVSGPRPEDGCQVGDGSLVPLGLITFADVLAPVFNLPNEMFLMVAPAVPVSAPSCAGRVSATLCDAPVFTAVCVTGGQFMINPTGGLVLCYPPLSRPSRRGRGRRSRRSIVRIVRVFAA